MNMVLEPFQLKILKQDIDKYIESDDDLIVLNQRYIYQKEKVDYLESVLKEITAIVTGKLRTRLSGEGL